MGIEQRYRLIPGGPGTPAAPRPAGRSWRRGVLTIVAVAVTIVMGARLWVWWQEREQRAVLALPTAERQIIYQHTLEAMQRLCSGPEADGLEGECRRQAQFLSLFPECDQACQRLVDPYVRSLPTR